MFNFLGYSAAFAAMAFTLASADARIMPMNHLAAEDDPNRPAQISEALFRQITAFVGNEFAPIVTFHGGKLDMVADWSNSEVNAFADRHPGNIWEVHMFGGLARRPEITPDGFLLVACHELGHHLAGFPYYTQDWGAAEGTSDYFATQVCARKLLGPMINDNQKFRFLAPEPVVFACNMNWRNKNEQELCYRIGTAAMSLATLLSRLNGLPVDPDFRARDKSAVTKTYEGHPEAQCRLDTYLAGALCNTPRNLSIIPGFNKTAGIGMNTVQAERAAYAASCAQETRFDPRYSIRYGARPLCWFKPEALPGR